VLFVVMDLVMQVKMYGTVVRIVGFLLLAATLGMLSTGTRVMIQHRLSILMIVTLMMEVMLILQQIQFNVLDTITFLIQTQIR